MRTDFLKKIEAFDSGALIVAGTTGPEPISTSCTPFTGSIYCPTEYFGGIDVFIALLDLGGVSIWQYIVGGEGNDNLNDMAFDNINNFALFYVCVNLIDQKNSTYSHYTEDLKHRCKKSALCVVCICY